MLVALKHRLMLIAAAVVTSWLAGTYASAALQPPDGSTGFAVTSTAVGVWQTLAVLLAIAVPVVAIGLIIGATDNPLAGPFVVGLAITVLSWTGGSSDGWFMRTDQPGGFVTLILETIGWGLFLVGLVVAIGFGDRVIRGMLPDSICASREGRKLTWALPKRHALIPAVICLVVAGACAYAFVRNSEPGQVLLSVMLAFGIGSMTAHLAYTQTNPIAILLSPFALAIVAYGYAALRYDDFTQVQTALNQMLVLGDDMTVPRINGLALVLPMQYVGAGLAGCALGLSGAVNVVAGDKREMVTSARIQEGPTGGFMAAMWVSLTRKSTPKRSDEN